MWTAGSFYGFERGFFAKASSTRSRAVRSPFDGRDRRYCSYCTNYSAYCSKNSARGALRPRFGLSFIYREIQSCPIRVLVLNGANFFDNEGMMALSSDPLLETLELVDCREITDDGLRFIVRTPSLINLTLRLCKRVTDVGVAELVRSQKLESLIIEGCRRVSEQAMQGAGRSVQYSVESASPGELKRIFR